jgi:hypothetical protein
MRYVPFPDPIAESLEGFTDYSLYDITEIKTKK